MGTYNIIMHVRLSKIVGALFGLWEPCSDHGSPVRDYGSRGRIAAPTPPLDASTDPSADPAINHPINLSINPPIPGQCRNRRRIAGSQWYRPMRFLTATMAPHCVQTAFLAAAGLVPLYRWDAGCNHLLRPIAALNCFTNSCDHSLGSQTV